MSLKDLNLKGLYDSDRDDLLNDFYIPVLSKSIHYKRIAGFFCSNALAIAAKGISKFVENGGKIQLIANVIISEKDQEAIKKAIEEKESKLINEIENLDDALKKGHLRLLAWMIKNNRLEIKIAVVPKGIEHKKKGILEDKEGNIISFSGSDNETVKGWLENDEEFHVFCSWMEEDKNRHLKPDLESFDRLWNDLANEVMVFPVSEAFKKGFLKTAPKNDDEFKELSKEMIGELLKKNKERIRRIKQEKREEIILRDYQTEAINKWFENEFRGIFEMATGTGKTEAAIGVINKLSLKKEPLLVIIVAYGQSLLYQWIERLQTYGYKSTGASSEFSDWRKEVRKKTMGISLGYDQFGIIVTTYQTFSSKDFIKVLSSVQFKSLLICDEVHHVGAPEFNKGLIENYTYRLGLSATPDRWFDDKGTLILKEYFGKTVYKFSMKRAMREINPLTGKTYLCQYKYYPIIVDLNPREVDAYLEITSKIQRRFHILKKFDPEDENLRNLLLRRADIIKNAESKIDELKKLFDKIAEHLEKCIIYCSGKQLEHVKNLLNVYGKIYHEFTQYQNAETREKLLNQFKEGRERSGYDTLLAIDCLNEGIDIPSAKVGIFLENSTNPIEFIQRRGRLLRQGQNKKEAILYDFIVSSSIDVGEDPKLKEIERKAIQKEFDRFVEFAHLASNTSEAFQKLENFINKYNLLINIMDDDQYE